MTDLLPAARASWEIRILSPLTLMGIALGLAMDAFAVSVAAGLAVAPVTRRHVFRLAFHFGLFQFLMPLAGWLAGTQLAAYVAVYDHWVAFALLSVVGAKMLWESLNHEEETTRADPTRGVMLVTLSVATSIDALAIGLSMAFLRVSVWFPAVVIGLVAAALTAAGLVFGSRLGRGVGHWAEALGGCVLLLIGTRILVQHLTA
jgi:putative Mn2+ efflux pump MntP